ncbi:hypothetical protein CONPUDRAFT_116757 [Coniophora puteana RWD-64-598 SS2]|uniref:SWIM-type domain-containing protein n=1 Tax=Coniophora puteana (strain RWD-64-598) TaxID=741705 RepID=A0A5M3MZQ1_CONPW|nr:uncharacterized protein CONPUDRAFT_116757 [Coniophora puteana RWD-64-598 SS2]EIW84622.1 hypothetical protein CONPUDRAFT_116757 [Coniophora puteana RWD-64-598 SS2]
MYPTPHYPAPLPSSSKPTQPTKKRQRKKDPANDEPPPEKRGAIMKKKCPKNILDRVDRVMSQRFFMLSRRRNPGELREEFGVLGSTGNVYTVTIGNFPSCSCPDASKGNHCKHILFIYLKVLQVPQESHVWYQKALLTSELDEIFSRATPAPNSAALADHHIQEAYARATGASSSQPSSSSGKDKGKPKRKELGPEDDCAVCYEAMGGKGSESLTWCDACGNALHSQCFAEWARSSRGSVTCVYCRVPWPNAPMKTEAKNAGDDNRSEGYLNLAGVAGISPVRDTSSYYHGYGHGRRYYGSIDDDFE